MFWINIDLKEFKKTFSYSFVGFFEIIGFFSLEVFFLGLEEFYGVDDYSFWVWVFGGGCVVEVYFVLKWFFV